jgi:hypothetical protein
VNVKELIVDYLQQNFRCLFYELSLSIRMASFDFQPTGGLFRSTVEQFPDERTGDSGVYSMADAAIGAFSVFFTQSPSFLDFQRTLGR